MKPVPSPRLSKGVGGGGLAAFTLIEVMVVIVIIAVLSTMAALSLQGRAGSAELRTTAQTLLRFAQYGRDHAVTRARPCRLVIDVPNRRYYLERPREDEATDAARLAGTQEQTVYEVVTDAMMRPRTLPTGVSFGIVRIEPTSPDAAGATVGADLPAVVFTPRGEADAAVIEVTDGEVSYTLRIAPSTGRAEVVSGREEQLLSDRMDLDE